MSLLLAVPLMAVVACGDEDAIRVAVTDYYDALIAEEPDRACAKLTANAQQEAVRLAVLETQMPSAGADSWCVAAMNRYYLESEGSIYAEVRHRAAQGTITVEGRTASVQPAGGLPLRVIRRGDRWVLDTLGLKPQIALSVISTYCSEGAPAVLGRIQQKDRAVEYLIGVLRRGPDAARNAVRPPVVGSLGSLRDGDCDRRSARRLERALRNAVG